MPVVHTKHAKSSSLTPAALQAPIYKKRWTRCFRKCSWNDLVGARLSLRKDDASQCMHRQPFAMTSNRLAGTVLFAKAAPSAADVYAKALMTHRSTARKCSICNSDTMYRHIETKAGADHTQRPPLQQDGHGDQLTEAGIASRSDKSGEVFKSTADDYETLYPLSDTHHMVYRVRFRCSF